MALIRHYLFEMLTAPLNKCHDGRHERLARFRQRILHTGRDLREHLTMDEVALLQTFQRLREHLLGTVRHQTADLIETQDTRLTPVEHEEHQHRPLVAEATYHLPDGTGQILSFDICHNL